MPQKRLTVLLLLLAFAAFCHAQIHGCDEKTPLKLSDNGFHYKKAALWMEWTTFTIVKNSAPNGVVGMLNYIFVKAANLAGVAILYPCVVVPDRNTSYHVMDKYLLNHFHASPDTPEITFNNGVTKPSYIHYTNVEGSEYKVVGNTKDSKLSWDLLFTKTEGVEPWCISNNTRLPYMGNFSWISYLPAAKVAGTVTIAGEQMEVQGYGETNHPWGAIMEPWLSWTWGNVNNDKFALYFVDAYSEGVLRIVIEGKLYYWLKNEYNLQQQFVNGTAYPVSAKIQADSAIGKIVVTNKIVSVSASAPGEAAENSAFYTIDLCLTGKPCVHYEEYGWCEYSKHLITKLKDVLAFSAKEENN